jgi:hypothetical protein
MTIRIRKALARMALMLVAAGGAIAAVPQTMTYQGFVKSAGGVPVNEPVSLTLRLYDALQNGTKLWEETLPNVTVNNGVFTVELGKVTALNLPFDAPYFLSIQVNSDPELTPRQPLTSVPYAFRALTPTGPPGPSSIATCPAGMTKVEFATFTICYHTGIMGAGTWDQASQFCYDSFRAPLCSVQQWRFLVCQNGTANPGSSWIGTSTGLATFATISGCTGESVGSAAYSTQRAGPCCLEWMKY